MSGNQEAELQRIKGLFDKGLIDEEEYKNMKRQVIMGPVTTPPPSVDVASADMGHLSDMGTTIDGPVNAVDGPPSGLNDMGTFIGSADVETIGSYRVLELLGQGGMGSVFKGRHINEQYAKAMGDVAIKMIQPSLATDASFKSRFINEAIFGKKLSHPNIAGVIDVVDDGGVLALLMDFIEGRELKELIPEDGMPIDEVIRFLKPIASALDYLHGEGIVHRDMKPANVRVQPDGTPVILDFGIAKDTNEVDSGMTQTGTAMGTQTYMAPEQMDAKRVTGAADQYALAMMAYQMLSGKLPWDAALSSARITVTKMTGDFNSLEELDGTSKSVSEAVLKGLSLKPDDRHQSCMSLIVAIESPSTESQESPSPADASQQHTSDQVEAPIDETVVFTHLSYGFARAAEAKKAEEERLVAEQKEKDRVKAEQTKLEAERLEKERQELAKEKDRLKKLEEDVKRKQAAEHRRDLVAAEALGVNVRDYWTVETLQQEIDAVTNKPEWLKVVEQKQLIRDLEVFEKELDDLSEYLNKSLESLK